MIRQDKLKELYERGENISTYLRKELNVDKNTQEIIEISYDLQTGSYIEGMKDTNHAKYVNNYTQEIANEILDLCEPISIMEAGVGEATTLASVLKNLSLDVKSYGFDLSWSRAFYAQRWLKDNSIYNSSITTGDLLNIPFCDNSIDVVYTSHSIEPNGGKEEDILKELYRVANRYVVLLEPGYEFASDEAKKRMDSHGYCKKLKDTALSLGYNVIKHELFKYAANALNPTAIMIIKKENTDSLEEKSEKFACPIHKTPLIMIEDTYFSKESLHVYPIINGIPCLRRENSILASKYTESFTL